MNINNEILFFLEIFAIGSFLLLFLKKKNESFLKGIFIGSVLLMNMFASYEIVLFGIQSSITEPIGVITYYIAIYLWKWEPNKAQLFFQNLLKINFFFIIITLFLIFYQNNILINNSYQFILKEFIYNTLISLFILQLTYRLERYIFNTLHYFVKSPYKELISILLSQLLDTILYTGCIFFKKSIFIKLQIIFFSYLVKSICILSYTIFLM